LRTEKKQKGTHAKSRLFFELLIGVEKQLSCLEADDHRKIDGSSLILPKCVPCTPGGLSGRRERKWAVWDRCFAAPAGKRRRIRAVGATNMHRCAENG
jgi:hypothetical protein